ncbi:LAFE_0H11474g1_1 [Lachancea fermentati]|uniref:LAFE_0H11474g1_1 n=1 Tax=Lachancea fermentati TaxID=4955 RepID=A0A1G4MKC6_LACFM|nr:LAFE_0H11474g1_1 [Lachancea fermentati]
MLVDRAKILKGLQILCSRKALRFIPFLLVLVGVLMISVRMKYSKIEKFIPFYKEYENAHLEKIVLTESLVHIENMDIVPIHKTAVSPLDLIDKYNEDIADKKRQSGETSGDKSPYKYFPALEMPSRCYFYYRNLKKLNPNWSNDFKRWTFLPKNLADMDVGKVVDEDGQSLVSADSILFHKRLNNVALVMERMRIYQTCFSGSIQLSSIYNDDHLELEFDRASKYGTNGLPEQTSKEEQWDFEHRMWPIIKYYNKANFTKLMPIIIGSTGPLEQGHLPLDGSRHPEGEFSAEYKYDDDKSFLWNWNNMSSKFASRGIVLSFEESEVTLAAKLIATLRYLKNELPIQIITMGDLSEESIRKLYEIAEGNDIFDPSVKVKNRNAPKQVIWFVDVSPTLDPSYSHEFKGTRRQLLAALLNLFNEYIFMDVHIIPYISMDNLQSLRSYRGALFFQGNAAVESSLLDSSALEHCRYMLSDLFPSWAETYYEVDDVWFDDYAMENTCATFYSPEKRAYKNLLYRNSRDNIDNGIFIIDKYKRMSSLMIGTFLSLGKICEKCGIEDKEFLWLGFTISSTGYEFSKYVKPAVVGESVDLSQELSDTDRMLNHKIVKICSESLSHVTTGGQLIWANFGVNYCGLEGVHSDGNKTLKSEAFTTAEELNKLHKTLINPKECIFTVAGNDALNTVGESCSGHLVCATYEQHVRPYTFDEIIERGSMVHIKSDFIAEYDRINEVWDKNYLT